MTIDIPISAAAGITLNFRGQVAEILFDLASQKNTFQAPDVNQLLKRLEEAVHGGARCIVIRGAGPVFSAGWDISSINPDGDDAMAMIAEVVGPFCKRLRELPVPTISAVAGPALGFGLGVALGCDICIVDEDALLGSPFRNIGLVPDTGAHYFFLERLGYHRAMELICSGRLLSGQAAAEMGLVNRAVAAGTLVEQVAKLADLIASGPTQAFRLSKDILLKGGSFDEMMALEAKHQGVVFKTSDTTEGISAFKQRRKPMFTGI